MPRSYGGSPANSFQLALHSTRAVEGIILKPNMLLPGINLPAALKKCKKRPFCQIQDQVRLTHRQPDEVQAVDEVADATVKCLLRAVPAAVPGIVFLSGGQSAKLASARLNAMNVRFKSRLPWALAFSFTRAIHIRPGKFGRARKPTCRPHSKRSFVEKSATGPRVVANTLPRWNRHAEHEKDDDMNSVVPPTNPPTGRPWRPSRARP